MGKMKELWAAQKEADKKRIAVNCEVDELINDIRRIADADNMVLNEMLNFLESNKKDLADIILAKYAPFMK